MERDGSAIIFEIGERYQEDAEKYYKWLIDEAKKQQKTEYYDKVSYEISPYTDNDKNKVAVKLKEDTNNIKVAEEGENYIVGPYELEREFCGPFSLEVETIPDECTILKEKNEQENEKEKVEKLEDVVGEEKGTYKFYLQIPKTEDISNVKLKIKVKSNNRLLTLLLGEDAQKEQPVLLVENKSAEQDFEIDITIKGTFKFKLVKKLEGIDDIKLSGAKFKVSIKENGTDKELVQNGENGQEKIFTTAGKAETTGTAQQSGATQSVEEGTFEIPNLNISGPNKTYTITVTETEAPKGYIGLSGPITFEAKSKLGSDGKSYVLESNENMKVTNAKKVEIKEGEILVEAENRPEVHKGVKEIYNQDSGYDGDEVQEWVIHTKVPSEIEKYGKFEITDKIDEKLVYQTDQKVVVAVVTMDGEGNNKKEKTSQTLEENKNYKVNYDSSSKTLTIKFVDMTTNSDGTTENNFEGLTKIAAGSTISIRFKTK